MTATLRIALVCPHALPPRDDVAHHVAAEAAALAARGHRVTLLAPATRRERIAAGRARLTAAGAGDHDALLAAPGEVLEVAVGRALPAGAGRRLGEPFDLAGALETALAQPVFDVVHLHEPLAPSPALAALRHVPGVAAVTFHRAEPLVGVAFLRPLVDRALARAHLRIATTAGGRRALSQMLPGDYAVIAPGASPAAPVAPPPGAPGLVIAARGRDRVAARFGLSVLRGLDPAAVGPVTLIGPADAPWRTRAAVPKALRDHVTVVPDPGPAARAAILAAAGIVVVAAPDEADGPVLREALAAGRAVIAPRCHATDELVAHGRDGLVLPPFRREDWAAAVTGLAGDAPRRAVLGRAAARAAARTWGDAAAELEAAYRAALAARSRPAGAGRVVADLRVRPGRDLSPERLVAACVERGVDVVGVAAPEGVALAAAVAALAPAGLTVVPGQEIATSAGVLVGLYLSHDVPPGLSPESAAAAVRDQGGLVLLPRAGAEDVPPAEVLRRIQGEIDCHELGEDDDEGTLRRLGVLVVAASGARRPEDVGAAVTELRRFEGPSDLLDALTDARIGWPERVGRRLREPRARGRRNRSHES
ncbi:glycosyltransferase [Miltoncostaea oceani]|uniref:glycosyltransferase n=1 Tax=Miltoncostaea oceani TaxID=2843216 RepID=UPI001C3D3F72|nr:glycosyltransferase [Miltoncostaea oceani]